MEGNLVGGKDHKGGVGVGELTLRDQAQRCSRQGRGRGVSQGPESHEAAIASSEDTHREDTHQRHQKPPAPGVQTRVGGSDK